MVDVRYITSTETLFERRPCVTLSDSTMIDGVKSKLEGSDVFPWYQRHSLSIAEAVMLKLCISGCGNRFVVPM